MKYDLRLTNISSKKIFQLHLLSFLLLMHYRYMKFLKMNSTLLLDRIYM